MEKALAILLVVLLLWIAFRVARFFTRLVLLIVVAALCVAIYFFWLR